MSLSSPPTQSVNPLPFYATTSPLSKTLSLNSPPKPSPQPFNPHYNPPHKNSQPTQYDSILSVTQLPTTPESSVDFEEMESLAHQFADSQPHPYSSGVYVLPRSESATPSPFKTPSSLKKTSLTPTVAANDRELVSSLPSDPTHSSPDSDSEDDDSLIIRVVEPVIPRPRTQKVGQLKLGGRFGKNIIDTSRSDPGTSNVNRSENDSAPKTEQDPPSEPGPPSSEPGKLITDIITFSTTREELLLHSPRLPVHSPIKKLSPKKSPRPYNNYKKFEEMESKGDWYVANDGSKYKPKWKEYVEKDRGDPEKLMGGERGFRLYSGKRSEWTLPVDYSVRNSGPYKGHVDEAALIEGRGIKEEGKDKWISDKRWNVIGCRTKPEMRRKVARGFHGKHGDLHEGKPKV
ncbi:hypothetical protein TrST_g6437 [Triparma strigata]|uniref:Uncharacterized protein n=1 Tax=Triparma strigata TaxID=1606541 RepID=A0A9W6ZJB3_9STRA|nr:hypothetical protein TrST_g6437 [Triparma strigata]